MKADELRGMSTQQQLAELDSLLRAHLTARIRIANQALTNTATVRTLRRDIARVRTVLAEQRGRAAPRVGNEG